MTGMLDSVSATGTCLLYVLLKKVLMFKMRKKTRSRIQEIESENGTPFLPPVHH